MNGKRLYREYAKSLGLDCASFVKVEHAYYEEILHYKDSTGRNNTLTFTHEKMVHWIIKVGSNKVFDHMLLSD